MMIRTQLKKKKKTKMYILGPSLVDNFVKRKYAVSKKRMMNCLKNLKATAITSVVIIGDKNDN